MKHSNTLKSLAYMYDDSDESKCILALLHNMLKIHRYYMPICIL